MADSNEYSDPNTDGFSDTGHGVIAVGGDTIGDYRHWGWKQIEAAIFGGGGVDDDSYIKEPSDPETIQKAADALYYTQRVLEKARDAISAQTEALTGENGPWQGPAAKSLRTAMSGLVHQTDQMAKNLSGGSSHDYGIPQQLANSAAHLRSARQWITDIDRWYAKETARVRPDLVMDNGLVEVRKMPKVVQLLTRDMLQVLDTLSRNYAIVRDNISQPSSPGNPNNHGASDSSSGPANTSGPNTGYTFDPENPDGDNGQYGGLSGSPGYGSPYGLGSGYGQYGSPYGLGSGYGWPYGPGSGYGSPYGLGSGFGSPYGPGSGGTNAPFTDGQDDPYSDDYYGGTDQDPYGEMFRGAGRPPVDPYGAVGQAIPGQTYQGEASPMVAARPLEPDYIRDAVSPEQGAGGQGDPGQKHTFYRLAEPGDPNYVDPRVLGERAAAERAAHGGHQGAGGQGASGQQYVRGTRLAEPGDPNYVDPRVLGERAAAERAAHGDHQGAGGQGAPGQQYVRATRAAEPGDPNYVDPHVLSQAHQAAPCTENRDWRAVDPMIARPAHLGPLQGRLASPTHLDGLQREVSVPVEPGVPDVPGHPRLEMTHAWPRVGEAATPMVQGQVVPGDGVPAARDVVEPAQPGVPDVPGHPRLEMTHAWPRVGEAATPMVQGQVVPGDGVPAARDVVEPAQPGVPDVPGHPRLEMTHAWPRVGEAATPMVQGQVVPGDGVPAARDVVEPAQPGVPDVPGLPHLPVEPASPRVARVATPAVQEELAPEQQELAKLPGF